MHLLEALSTRGTYFFGKAVELQQIAGDGSDRKFFRLRSPAFKQSFVVMQGAGSSDQAQQANEQWLQVRRELGELGLSVPRIYQVLPHVGAVVMEDFGDRTFEAHIRELCRQDGEHSSGIDQAYDQAFSMIARLLPVACRSWRWSAEPVFTEQKFQREWEFFLQHFGQRFAAWSLSIDERAALQRDMDKLIQFLLAAPQGGVHRDFHSRNLMVGSAEGPFGLIDFQDMRAGPYSYDVVSLCFDAYVPLSLQRRQALLERGLHRLTSVLSEQSVPYLRSSHWQPMLLQRQLKAMGSFAYLALEKGKRDFLQYFAPAAAMLRGQYDERWPFLSGRFIEQFVLPATEKAPTLQRMIAGG